MEDKAGVWEKKTLRGGSQEGSRAHEAPMWWPPHAQSPHWPRGSGCNPSVEGRTRGQKALMQEGSFSHGICDQRVCHPLWNFRKDQWMSGRIPVW